MPFRWWHPALGMYSNDSAPDTGRGINVDAAQSIHAVYKAVEIELDEMVYRDAQVLLDGPGQVVWAIGAVVEGGIHFLVPPDHAARRHGREQVAWDGEY